MPDKVVGNWMDEAVFEGMERVRRNRDSVQKHSAPAPNEHTYPHEFDPCTCGERYIAFSLEDEKRHEQNRH